MLPDLNVWFALCIPQHVHHRSVLSWFMKAEHEKVVFCRSTQQGLLRLLTTRAITGPFGLVPFSNRQAISRINAIMEDERIAFVEEPAHLWEQWLHFADSRHASPKLWMDAHLAAFAHSGGYQLVTLDKAFKQFKGLRLELLS